MVLRKSKPACDFCHEVRLDATVRPGLYPVSADGKKASQPYEGLLCDKCLMKTRQVGSPENQWLLRELGLER